MYKEVCLSIAFSLATFSITYSYFPPNMVRSTSLFAAAAIISGVAASSDLNSAVSLEVARLKRSSQIAPPTRVTSGLVDPKKLAASIERTALEEKSKQLEEAAFSTPARNRVFSSQGHLNTLDLIESYLNEVGDYYTYSRQEFQALYSKANGNLTVAGVPYDPIVFQYSASTTGDGIKANFVAVSNQGCNATDYPPAVSGQIALISRGTCDFGLKSARAGAAGAVGAVIYNNANGTIGGGTLGPPGRPEGAYVPTAGITRDNATTILTAVNNGQVVQGLLQVFSLIENRTTYVVSTPSS